MIQRFYLLVPALMLLANTAFAQVAIPITPASVNWDAIAESNPASASSTAPGMDGSNYVVYSTTYAGNPGGGFPASLLFVYGAKTYQLQQYTGNNALRIMPGTSGTLTLQTPQILSSVFLLVTSTEGSAPVQLRINYTDGTMDNQAATTIPDWVGGAGGVSVGQRVSRADGLFSATAKVFEIGGIITGPNAGKTVQSITVTNNSTGNPRAYVFGVVGACAGPVFTQCPANLTGVCNSAVNYTASATGASSYSYTFSGATTGSGSGTGSGSFFNVGVTTVVITANSTCGSSTCTFTVTVPNSSTPTISCPANITLPNATGLCGRNVSFANATASNPCGGSVTVTQIGGPSSGSFFPVGVTTVTFRAQNTAGITATCSFTVTINDTQAPALVCPPNKSVPTTGFTCAAAGSGVLLGVATASDNCGISGLPTNNAPNSYPVGSTSVIWTVKDLANNTATCVQTVTVIDQYQPVLQCPGTVQATADPTTCTATVDYAVTAYDNCSSVNVNYSHPPLSDFQLNNTLVTVTAVDGSGNASTCTFLVQVGRAAEICNDIDDDCDGLVDEADTWQNVGRRLASDGLAGEQYGTAIGIHGNYAVVGAKDKDSGGQTIGGAYLLHRTANGTWQQLAKLVPQGLDAGDDLGEGVAVHGGWLALGAPGDDEAGQDAGAVYLYRQDANNADQWTQFTKITLMNGNAGDRLGAGLAMYGDYLLAGAVGDDESAADAGAVYVFSRNEGGADNWGMVTKLMAPFGSTDDQFGAAVDFDGAHAIISAAGDDQFGSNAGAAYIFGKNTGGTNNWGLVKKLTAGDGDSDDNFGADVAIAGDFAMVGATGQDDKGTNAGKVYVYYRDQWSQPNSWGQYQGLLDYNGKPGDNFGAAVAMEGFYAAVGASGVDFLNNLDNAGNVTVYQRQLNGYVVVASLTPAPQRADSHFGSLLAMSDRTLIAGVPLDDQGTQLDRGSVTFFEALCAGLDLREAAIAAATATVKAFPVPFSDQLTIQLRGPAAARITVLNNFGQEVALVYDGALPTDGAQFEWQAGRFESGLYFVRVQTTNGVETKAVTLVR